MPSNEPRFEFDMQKSLGNRAKHGIDFIEARALWKDARRVEVPARTEGEARLLVIGAIGEKVWSAIITLRNDKIRIISVRRARDEEVELYEGG